MGAWGTALYSDDEALDVKDSYIELLKETQSHEESFKRCKEQFSDTLNEKMPDCEAIFWFVIAERQWFYGVLFPEVKAKALEFLSRNEHLELWEETDKKQLNERKVVLNKLREKILSPLPPVRKLPKIAVSAYRLGDIVAVKITEITIPKIIQNSMEFVFDSEKYQKYLNKYFIFHVAGLCSSPDLGRRVESYIKFFYWCGDTVPSISEIEKMDYMPFHDYMSCYNSISSPMIQKLWKDFTTDDGRAYFSTLLECKAKHSKILGNIPFITNLDIEQHSNSSIVHWILAPAFYVMYDELQRINWDGKSKIKV